VRLSIDEELWARHGRYGVDYDPADYERLSGEVEESLAGRLVELVRKGQDVVVDFSFHARARRDRYRQLVDDAGGEVELVYLRADASTLRARLRDRSSRFDANAAFPITDALLDGYLAGFEPPAENERPTVIDVADR
jgi:predicted kinase